MKINEIANPYLRGFVKGLTGLELTPAEKTQPAAGPKNQSVPSPTSATSTLVTPAEPAPTSITAPRGIPPEVSVLATNPIILQVGKQKYELDDMDQWHPLGSKRTVSPGQAAILNKYLEML